MNFCKCGGCHAGYIPGRGRQSRPRQLEPDRRHVHFSSSYLTCFALSLFVYLTRMHAFDELIKLKQDASLSRKVCSRLCVCGCISVDMGNGDSGAPTATAQTTGITHLRISYMCFVCFVFNSSHALHSLPQENNSYKKTNKVMKPSGRTYCPSVCFDIF